MNYKVKSEIKDNGECLEKLSRKKTQNSYLWEGTLKIQSDYCKVLRASWGKLLLI